MSPLYDAHNHLQDPRLAAAIEELPQFGLKACVVNGTSEKDWPLVSALAKKHHWILPAFGLHPWYAAERTNRWLDKLQFFLDEHPNASIGEIGLDRWMPDPNATDQETIFREQLAIAGVRKLTATIHCLKAWGPLELILRAHTTPFLLHSYGGSAEMIPSFARIGAYFSFSGYFAHDRKVAQREIFKKIPLDRLLIETDAPDMLPPPELRSVPADFNDPRNITRIYTYAAQLWNIPEPQLVAEAEKNFARLFLAPK